MNDSRRLFLGLMADDEMRNVLETARSGWAWPPSARMGSNAVWHGGVVVLLAEGSAELDALRQSTTAAVSAAGLEIDPRWTPHVTLARHVAAVQAPAAIEPLIWSPQAMSLVWSRREVSGYEVVRSWPAPRGPVSFSDSRA